MSDTTPTRVLDPNAPRIEFFTADSQVVAPGSPLTLFWSTRGVSDAAIYQLNRQGERGRVWNVGPDGSVSVSTRESDRGQLDFVLSIGEGLLRVEQGLSIPLACPVIWFFAPPPLECPDTEPQEVFVIEQQFQRGRMVYTEFDNRVYALFNDGFEPAWISFENRYDPAVHPELDEDFERAKPAGFFQPIARLGFVWRGNDTVRNRLGLGINAEIAYQGLVQTAGEGDLYISSTDATALHIIGDGDSWEIITSP